PCPWISIAGEQAAVSGGRASEFGASRAICPDTVPPTSRKQRSRAQRASSTGPACRRRASTIRGQRGEQRIPSTAFPRRENRRVERLALAEQEPDPQPRA